MFGAWFQAVGIANEEQFTPRPPMFLQQPPYPMHAVIAVSIADSASIKPRLWKRVGPKRAQYLSLTSACKRFCTDGALCDDRLSTRPLRPTSFIGCEPPSRRHRRHEGRHDGRRSTPEGAKNYHVPKKQTDPHHNPPFCR